jgi:acyl-CoA hydrolase/GNAT superfamily N-acetyltransferase
MSTIQWTESCADKVMPPEQAMRLIRPGDHVFLGTAAAEPRVLVKALVEYSSHLADIELFSLLTIGEAPYAEDRFADRFRFNTFFIGDNVRSQVERGFGDYTPVFLSEIPRLFDSGRIPLDVALIQVTPPDRNGFCCLGVSVDVIRSAIRNAVTIIAQVNDQMPRTHGDTLIHVNEIDSLVEGNCPIPETPFDEPSPEVEEIAKHVAKLVEDGSTIQVGIGRIPQAVLRHLTGHRNLGIHTEMFTDGIIDLMESGVVTNRKKTLHANKVVASFCMGTKRLYDYVDDNPNFEFHPSEYVNDPFVVSRHDAMVAINTGIEVDLTGQVCSDSLGTKFYSGFGGQVDFIRGAARSSGGKPIIALPSTTKDGTVSRITVTLKEGAGVVTTRGDVHYVVTEFGVAYLHGRSIRERAMALIEIAHPKFREELLRKAKELHYVFPDQKEVPWADAQYPEEVETRAVLAEGTEVFVRPLKPSDEESFKDLFYSLSDDSRYKRFVSHMRSMPHSNRQHYVAINYAEQLGIAAVVQSAEGERFLGVAQYIKSPNLPRAEVAVLVQDDWQSKGLGSFMVKHLIRHARKVGLKGFDAEVLAENRAMMAVFEGLPYPMSITLDEGAYHLSFDF